MTLLRDGIKMAGAYGIARSVMKEYNKHEEIKHQPSNPPPQFTRDQFANPPPYDQYSQNSRGQYIQATRDHVLTADGYLHADYCNGSCGGRCNGTQAQTTRAVDGNWSGHLDSGALRRDEKRNN